MGDFWNEDGISKYKDEILKCNREVGRTFKRAYRYIKAAYSIYEDSEQIIGWCTDNAKVNGITEEIKNELLKDIEIAHKEGKVRKLFASAITPNGFQNYLETILDTEKVCVLKGESGTGTEKVLNKIKDAVVERGFDVEAFYCALNPTKLEHLVVNDLDVSFTTLNEYHNVDIKNIYEINLDDYTDRSKLIEYSEILKNNKSNFNSLMDLAVKTIAKAKELHDKMETYYIPNMDFESVQMCWESTLARIIKYSKENI